MDPVSVDIAGPLSHTTGNRYICVVSKWPNAFALLNNGADTLTGVLRPSHTEIKT